MQYQYQDQHTGAEFILTRKESHFERNFFLEQGKLHHIIIWNTGSDQPVEIDGLLLTFPANTFMALNQYRTVRLQSSADMVFWQFNKEFYCIVTHDEEVSCTGVLFFSSFETDPIILDEKQTRLLALLIEIFIDEFGNHDNIQGEMLRMLLKRLIIKLTRLVKTQTPVGNLSKSELLIVRQFHLLVEVHYKQKHQVKDYAELLHKSPKTLSNFFSSYTKTGPLQVILDRIFLESKRLLLYTDHTLGEISTELGFAEAAHFSRFFKNMSGVTASEFRKTHLSG